MKLRNVLLAATLLAVPMAVNAQPVTGIYVGLGAGVNWIGQQSSNNFTLNEPTTASTFPTSSKINTNVGFVGLGSVGYGLGNGLRVELEGAYRNNSFHSIDTGANAGFASVSMSGHEQKFGPMFNALYDFPVAPWFVPYIGAGVGYQWVRWQNAAVSGTDPLGNSFFVASNKTDGNFAYQAILGAGFPIGAIPGLALTAEFRFLGTSGQRTYDLVGFAGANTATGTLKVSNEQNYAGLVGFRYNFGVAPPPPPPAPAAAPAPAPQRSYLVFFDWDKYNLTDRAKAIIADAAANIPKVEHTRIEVNGYTDTSGTPKYNKGLSIRRANAVAAELVRLGVKKEEIAIEGFGDTHLLVPTGPGVREPQNRRVEIIIR